MKRTVLIAAAVLSLALAGGCTHVITASGGNSTSSNDNWFTEITGFPLMLIWDARVYYCPATTGGAATCIEAEMIDEASPGVQVRGDSSAGPLSPTPPPPSSLPSSPP